MLGKLHELLVASTEHLLFAGVGNVLRSDDGAGVYICRNLKPSPSCTVLLVETSIENYIGKINKSNADVLILVDCVDFGKYPGYMDFIPSGELLDLTFHTHNISLNKIAELFRMPSWVLGIQPADTSFGERMSDPVMQAAGSVIQMINAAGK